MSAFKKNKWQSFLLIIAFLFLVLSLYYNQLNYYFFQDDWFHLKISNPQNLRDFLNFFLFRTDIIAWRPISKQLFFFVIINFFKLNSYVSHLTILIFHFANAILIYKIIKKISGSVPGAFTTAFLYSSAVFHFTALAWISAGEYTIGTFFYLLASLTALLFFETKEYKFFLSSLVAFILCLASTELAVSWPFFIIFLNIILERKKNSSEVLKLLFPVGITIVVYFIMRLILFRAPLSGNYAVAVNIQIIKNYFWYILWLFNVPESFKNFISISNLSFSKEPTFYKITAKFILKILIPVCVFVVTVIYLFFSTINKKNLIIFISSFAFLFVGLLPVLIFQNHAFSHYLLIPSLGVYIWIGLMLAKKFPKKHFSKQGMVLIFVMITSWYFSSYFSLAYTEIAHWIPGEQAVSRQVSEKVAKELVNVPRNSQITINSRGEIAQHALMDQDGLQILLNDSSIKTIYTYDNLHHDRAYFLYISLLPGK